MTTIAQTDAMRLLADLAARYAAEPYDATRDITLAEFMAASGITSEDAARRALDAEIAAGQLTKRLLATGRGRCYFYRKP